MHILSLKKKTHLFYLKLDFFFNSKFINCRRCLKKNSMLWYSEEAWKYILTKNTKFWQIILIKIKLQWIKYFSKGVRIWDGVRIVPYLFFFCGREIYRTEPVFDNFSFLFLSFPLYREPVNSFVVFYYRAVLASFWYGLLWAQKWKWTKYWFGTVKSQALRKTERYDTDTESYLDTLLYYEVTVFRTQWSFVLKSITSLV